jgi:hypothetical protein
MPLLTISAASFLLAHFLTSVWGRFPASQEESISPKWSADLHTAIEGAPLGVVAGGKGHEYEYKPQTSLWFTDNDTIVVTFVIRRGDGSPKLAHHGVSDENLPLRLRALFLDAATGKIRAMTEWPAESRRASIVAAHDGKFVTQTGENLIQYSSDMKELRRLSTPPVEPMEGSDLVSSPTGRTVLFTVRTSSTAKWIWVNTDNLEVLLSWEEKPRGRVSISDSKIVMTACTLWFYKCDPEIDIKGRTDTSWKKIENIDDRRHPPMAGFIDENLLFLQRRSIRLLRTDGTMVMEDETPEGCWGSGITPSAGGKRFVIPSCKVKGRVESLDLSGHDELKSFSVYDAPFQGRSHALSFKGPKIKMPISLALSPDGSLLAVLNGESVYVFQLPLIR